MNAKLTACCVVAAAALAACADKSDSWSKPKATADGKTVFVGTLGLGLSLGPSGQVEMLFGSMGTRLGAETPAAIADVQTEGVLPVGAWSLTKGTTRVTLPREASGFVKTYGLYENTHAELWQILTSPGCATLTTASAAGTEPGASIIERTYQLCDVDQAAARLKQARTG